jgi:tagaturonate reductase
VLTGAPVSHPILQFGTGRFLQAHVDLFVSQALAEGNALGRIAVVQTSDSRESTERLAALARAEGYPIEIRGLQDGRPLREVLWVNSVGAAWSAARDWPCVRAAIAEKVQVVVSNTADRGYELSSADDPAALDDPARPPASFPAKLLALLHHRWSRSGAPLTLLPCELVSRNGDVLRDIVLGLAAGWRLPDAFLSYLRSTCVWANSLVDRIVSSPLYPVGAVAEPYALWAIERRDRLVLPCRHPAIVVTTDLARYERLKLMLLNLGHTFLAERWLVERRRSDEMVREAMDDEPLRSQLEAVWLEEVVPVFDAAGEGAAATAYLDSLRERLKNPFLDHRLSDIAQDHAQKKRRRFEPVVAWAAELGLGLPQARLRAALA